MRKLNISELSKSLEEQIKQSDSQTISLTEIGTVLTIGDGIARVYGLCAEKALGRSSDQNMMNPILETLGEGNPWVLSLRIGRGWYFWYNLWKCGLLKIDWAFFCKKFYLRLRITNCNYVFLLKRGALVMQKDVTWFSVSIVSNRKNSFWKLSQNNVDPIGSAYLKTSNNLKLIKSYLNVVYFVKILYTAFYVITVGLSFCGKSMTRSLKDYSGFVGFRSFSTILSNIQGKVSESKFLIKTFNRKWLYTNSNQELLKIQKTKRMLEFPDDREICGGVERKKIINILSPFEKLKALSCEKDGCYINIVNKFLADPYFLQYAYHLIKNNSVAEFGCLDFKEIEEVNWSWFLQTAVALKKGVYLFKYSRKFNVSKLYNKKIKNFFKPCFKDQIIQKAIQLVLEEIYEVKESLFLNCSQGFRLGRSCHSVLKVIKEQWTSISWYLSWDIKFEFSSMSRDFLFMCLKRKIKDIRLYDILHKMFKARILSFLGFKGGSSSIFQGNSLFYILSNIYFHELDVFITEKILKRFRIGINSKNHLDCVKLKISDKQEVLSVTRKSVQRTGVRVLNKFDSYCSVRYIRYLDDFLLGVRGSKKFAEKIQQAIFSFLKSELYLEVYLENSILVNSYSDKFRFLGMLLYKIPLTKQRTNRGVRALENKKKQIMRVEMRLRDLRIKREKVMRFSILERLRLNYIKAIQSKKIKKYSVELQEIFGSGLFFSNLKKEKISSSVSFADMSELSMLTKKHLYRSNFGTWLDGVSFKLTTRTLYKMFIMKLLRMTDIKNKKRTQEFLHIWKDELDADCISSKKNLNICYLESFKENVESVCRISINEAIQKMAYYLTLKGFPTKEDLSWKQVFFGIKCPKFFLWPTDWIITIVKKCKLLLSITAKFSVSVFNLRMAFLDLFQFSYKEKQQKVKFKYYSSKLNTNCNLGKVSNLYDNIRYKNFVSIQIKADIAILYKWLYLVGIINGKKKPIAKSSLLIVEDILILTYFRSVAFGILSFYRCVDNFGIIKNIIQYQVRMSLIYTLMTRHKLRSVAKTLRKYGEVISVEFGESRLTFIDLVQLRNIKKEFFIKPCVDFSSRLL